MNFFVDMDHLFFEDAFTISHKLFAAISPRDMSSWLLRMSGGMFKWSNKDEGMRLLVELVSSFMITVVMFIFKTKILIGLFFLN